LILLAMMIAVNALFTWVQLGARRDRWDRPPERDGPSRPITSPWQPR
jgi:hypothetical protein